MRLADPVDNIKKEVEVFLVKMLQNLVSLSLRSIN
jgi:hypothetical protein